MSARLFTGLLAAQSDVRLIELVGQGHERAFEVLVRRYRAPLLGYCRRMGLSDAQAEDVLQQALMRAWLALEGGTEVRELRAWLYRIVHNTAVNAVRGSREETGSLIDTVQVDGATSESEFEGRMAVRETLDDLAALPRLQREAILLSAVDGRPHDEVASVLGVSQGAVRGLLYRARVALRAAAAALTPAPLIGWASGTANRVAPTTARIAELTGAGGTTEMGGVLLKGTAVAASAALAAGAVLAPLHGHRAVRRHAVASGMVASAGARATADTADAASLAGGHPSATSTSAPAKALAVSTVGSATTPHSTYVPASREGSAPTQARPAPAPSASAPTQASGAGQSVSAQTSPSVTAQAAASSPPASSGGATSGTEGGSTGGSGQSPPSGSGSEGNHSESSGGDGASDDGSNDGSDDGSREGTGAGKEGDSGGSDSAEREAEAAHEHGD